MESKKLVPVDNLPEKVEAAPLPVPVEPQEIVPVDPFHKLSECKMTDAEIAILNAAPTDAELHVRYDGIVYMPGVCIRMRLNAAFGPGQWALKPEGPTQYDRENEQFAHDASLWIRGHWIARAVGGWRWIVGSKMTRLDAVECAKTECFRRVCKDIGIGLQLWIPGYCDEWRAEHCETYLNNKGKTCWKMKGGVTPQQTPAPAPRPAPTQNAREGGSQAAPASVPDQHTPGAAHRLPPGNELLPLCPVCGADMWDNRNKGSDKSPAFKCKKSTWDTATKTAGGCQGKIWRKPWEEHPEQYTQGEVLKDELAELVESSIPPEAPGAVELPEEDLFDSPVLNVSCPCGGHGSKEVTHEGSTYVVCIHCNREIRP